MTKDSRKPVLAVMTVLVVAAAACAGWFGWSWLSTARSGSLALARTRDTVLAEAEQGVLNFNTLNYHQASAGLQVWLASSTGDLHAELAQNLRQEIQLVQQRKTITTARILDGAVTELATGPGTATVIVAVEVTVTPSSGSPFVESESEVGHVDRTGSGWKLSSLGYPPGTEGASGSSSPSPSSSPTP
jgi:Mce-associated membrane protein